MVSLSDFMVGTFGMIPWVCVCTYIGSALDGLSDVFSEHHSKSYKTVLYIGYGVGTFTTGIVVYMISVYTRRAVQEAIIQGRQSTSTLNSVLTELEGDEEDDDDDVEDDEVEVEVALPDFRGNGTIPTGRGNNVVSINSHYHQQQHYMNGS